MISDGSVEELLVIQIYRPDRSCLVRGRKAPSGRSYWPAYSPSSTCLDCNRTSESQNQHMLMTHVNNTDLKGICVSWSFSLKHFTNAEIYMLLCRWVNRECWTVGCLECVWVCALPGSPPGVQGLWSIVRRLLRCTPGMDGRTLPNPSL